METEQNCSEPRPYGPYVGLPTVMPLQADMEPYSGLDCADAKGANKKRTKDVITQSALTWMRAQAGTNRDTNLMDDIALL